MNTDSDNKRTAYIDGSRDRAAERLSPSQWQMLHDIRDYDDPMYSRYDRATGTLCSLQRLGLVRRGENTLTEAGARMCRVVWHDQD